MIQLYVMKEKMKYIFLLLLGLLPLISHGIDHSFITFAPDRFTATKEPSTGLIEKAWNQIDEEKRKRIESILIMDFGLSSTGRIEAIGSYKLTHSDSLGSEGDRVFHFIQKDLMGSRLFWSCLINTDSMKIQKLYPTSGAVASEQIKPFKLKP